MSDLDLFASLEEVTTKVVRVIALWHPYIVHPHKIWWGMWWLRRCFQCKVIRGIYTQTSKNNLPMPPEEEEMPQLEFRRKYTKPWGELNMKGGLHQDHLLHISVHGFIIYLGFMDIYLPHDWDAPFDRSPPHHISIVGVNQRYFCCAIQKPELEEQYICHCTVYWEIQGCLHRICRNFYYRDVWGCLITHPYI